MSLVLALQGKDCIALGADSRGTVGLGTPFTSIKDTHTKLSRLTEYVGIAFAGAHNLAAGYIEEIQEELGSNQRTVFIEDVKDHVVKIIRSRYLDSFAGRAKEAAPFISFILAGFTDRPNTPKIQMLSSENNFAPELFPDGQAFVGVPQYAIYLMSRLYCSDLDIETLMALAAYAISETMTQEPVVGGPIQIARIAMATGYQLVKSEKTMEIIRLNEARNARFKREFHLGGDQV